MYMHHPIIHNNNSNKNTFIHIRTTVTEYKKRKISYQEIVENITQTAKTKKEAKKPTTTKTVTMMTTNNKILTKELNGL